MAVRQDRLERSIVPDIERPAEAVVEPDYRAARRRWRILLFVACCVLSIVFAIPLVWLVIASLKTRAEVFNSEWIPDPVTWSNYVQVWNVAPTVGWLWNSVMVGVLASATVVFSSALVAFGFSYFRFKGRDVLFGLVLATMMLPYAVTMVPTFIIWDALGWTNTHVPLWAHNLFGSAFYIFLLRQFFLGLPRDLFDAALVDGANPVQIWWRIAMPLTKPALIVVAIFEFKASWRDLMKPLIYLQDKQLFTMPLGLKTLLDQFGQGGIQLWNVVMAATVIITIPMLLIFLIGQRYFVQGIATTGTKG